MSHSNHNLCATVENWPRYTTARCTVGHAIQPWGNGGRTWAMYHKWTDHKGGYEGGTCENCGLTLKQCKVRINPKTGEPVRRSRPSIAREIARAARDVPPVRFIGMAEIGKA